MKKLTQLKKIDRKGPVLLVIMDGIGLGRKDEGDAFHLARTPNLDRLSETCIYGTLQAHGTAVGLPSDGDMGNSEVGHNALGAGRIFAQGAELVNRSIDSGDMFDGDTWKDLVRGPAEGRSTLHFLGLLSDGNVHSHINHLFTMIDHAAEEGVSSLRVHILLDGRDVPETSALEYVDSLEEHLEKYRARDLDYRIASGGGRMVTTMDRYEADWDIVKRGWEAHVLGEARPFGSAREAIETFRKEDPSITDQYLPAFTVTDHNGPVGDVQDGDSVILFNFRGDRSIEISQAFDLDDFPHFDRKRRPDVLFAGMMEYDGDLHIPSRYLVKPPSIGNTLSEYLVATGVTQFAISETQKFGHVTYFWNGNRTEPFDKSMETYVEIPSDRVEFNRKPWMKAAEITDRVIEALLNEKYDFLRLNYANGDMVGHTGDLEAAVIAAETVDLCLGRLLATMEKVGGITLITADHGNLDEMFEIDKKTGQFKVDSESGRRKKKTSHTLNRVPGIIHDPSFSGEYSKRNLENPGLANVAATLCHLLDLEPPEDYEPSLIKID
jgi:2,3-bisphosphoglycerate-independent phosphoglycerate mutase